MIQSDILLSAIAFIGISISSIVDIKTREIPNWTNFSMIAAALAIRLMHSITFSQRSYFLYGLLGLSLMFILGNLMYYTKQWGGGDSKLLFAIGAIFATKPYFVKEFPIPFLAVIFIAILLSGFFYSFIFSLILAIKYRKKFFKEIKEIHNTSRKIRYTSFGSAVLLAILSLFIKSFLVPLMLSLSALIIFSVYWILFSKAVEKACLTKIIQVSKLTEGEWIVDEKIRNKFKISKLGIEKYQIEQLKKAKIKEVLIKEGIPFAPSFLLALIIILLI